MAYPGKISICIVHMYSDVIGCIYGRLLITIISLLIGPFINVKIFIPEDSISENNIASGASCDYHSHGNNFSPYFSFTSF